jgi:uncharacterized small protein (DUF1192 family)
VTKEESKEKREKNHSGIELSQEELEEYERAFTEIDESIGLVMAEGEDL